MTRRCAPRRRRQAETCRRPRVPPDTGPPGRAPPVYRVALPSRTGRAEPRPDRLDDRCIPASGSIRSLGRTYRVARHTQEQVWYDSFSTRWAIQKGSHVIGRNLKLRHSYCRLQLVSVEEKCEDAAAKKLGFLKAVEDSQKWKVDDSFSFPPEND